MRDTPRGRERTEELERASLSTWATLAVETKGRDREEPSDGLRTVFQQDCDRILASVAFRRLRGKSHRHLAVEGEGPRTRLQHTLSTARAARTIARALRLNEDLAEAIALGHDLGAAAFATAGEEAFSPFCPHDFQHNEQALRVVEGIEGGGLGLNLTWEVRDGIVSHTPSAQPPATAEGQIVRLAARIVALTDDLDDALRAGVCVLRDLPDEVRAFVQSGDPHLGWVGRFLADVVYESADVPDITMSAQAIRVLDSLAEFIAQRVRSRSHEVGEHARSVHCLRGLVIFYLDNPERLPSLYRGDDPAESRTIDYVSGLTDAQALGLFSRLLLPAVTP